MMIKVICIKECKIFDKLYTIKYGEVYDVSEVEFGSAYNMYNLYVDNKRIGMVCKDNFVDLANWREIQIDNILD